MSIRILLADDHPIVREGYRTLLDQHQGMQIVAQAGDGDSAYLLYRQHSPDVAVIDVAMPGVSGLTAISRIKQAEPAARILAFSMHVKPAFALQATRAGALGYVSKSSSPEILINAILDVNRGKPALSPDVAQALAMEKIGHDKLNLERLSVREFEILRLLIAGYSHQAIAERLHISAKTVGNSHYLIKRKLDVASDIELTRFALKLNLIDLLECD
ncbi:response regulator [Methylomonas rhizoryzae]|uniref:response regulator n=1 Tax=Methylomonas rhizoryzae TaxID=2608981 RepID=UPI0012325310|nr:response regulator transcription factor [Methylomonas rhizoryzae]